MHLLSYQNFFLSNVNYNLWSDSQFYQPSANAAWKGQEIISYLTHFMPLVSFKTPWKHQKTFWFSVFRGFRKTSGMKWVKTKNLEDGARWNETKIIFICYHLYLLSNGSPKTVLVRYVKTINIGFIYLTLLLFNHLFFNFTFFFDIWAFLVDIN